MNKSIDQYKDTIAKILKDNVDLEKQVEFLLKENEKLASALYPFAIISITNKQFPNYSVGILEKGKVVKELDSSIFVAAEIAIKSQNESI